MCRLVLLSLLIAFSLPVMAQNNAGTSLPPSFKLLRQEEDYSYLRKDSSGSKYHRLKYSALNESGHTYLSIGGDVRFQYFNMQNAGWGDEPKDHDGYTFSRYLVHADLHAGKYFRAFAQLQSSMANGKDITSGVDENPLEVHQAFWDVNALVRGSRRLVFRLGRQEFLYGSQRIVSVRDGPNNRLAFDAVRAMLSGSKYKLDVFYSHPVAARKKIFDDKFNTEAKFWGGYFTAYTLPGAVNVDLYYVGLWKRVAVFDEGKGRELRHSLGSRVWGNRGSWVYDMEGLYQFGKFDDKKIGAWTASVHTGYEFKRLPLTPVLALKTEFISGNRHYEDKRTETFNPLFPRGAYFGLASIIGPSNLIDIHPSVALSVTRHLEWTVDCDVFWRYSKNDAIYGPSVAVIYSGKNIPDRFIGQQVSCDFTFTPSPFLYMRAEFTWFKAGDFLKAAGAGKSILFAGVTTQYKF